jgi:hypothetical protein
MFLAQHDVELLSPALVEFAETAIAIAVWLATRYSSQTNCKVTAVTLRFRG